MINHSIETLCKSKIRWSKNRRSALGFPVFPCGMVLKFEQVSVWGKVRVLRQSLTKGLRGQVQFLQDSANFSSSRAMRVVSRKDAVVGVSGGEVPSISERRSSR
jgi:hypothetical protein